MATTTTRLALRKPDPNPTTGDFVDVAADLNANMDKIDAAIGGTVCTSGTRPATPFDGQLIRETDTRRVMVRNATQSLWDSVSGAFTCTSGTRPGTPRDGEIIRETDTRKVLVYNATQTAWDVISGAATVTSGTRPSSPYDGMLIRETDTRRIAMYNATQSEWQSANGAYICTSSTRPGAPFDGMVIRETDTRRLYIYNATQAVWEIFYNGVAGPPVGFVFARRTSDSAGKQNNTMAADTELVLPVVANAVYALDAYIPYISPTAALFQMDWTAPSGSSMNWSSWGEAQTATSYEGSVKYEQRTLAQSAVVGGSGATLVTATPRGILLTAGTAGSLTFRWAQFTTTASDTKVHAGAWVRLMRVS